MTGIRQVTYYITMPDFLHADSNITRFNENINMDTDIDKFLCDVFAFIE